MNAFVRQAWNPLGCPGRPQSSSATLLLNTHRTLTLRAALPQSANLEVESSRTAGFLKSKISPIILGILDSSYPRVDGSDSSAYAFFICAADLASSVAAVVCSCGRRVVAHLTEI